MNPPVLPKEHLRTIERSSERHDERDGFIRLDRNERASPIPDTVLQDMLAQLTADDLMSYPDAGRFVARISKLVEFSEDHIAETAGSDAVLRRLFMAYVKPRDVVVTLRPAYAMYELYTRIFQGVSRPIDYRSDRTCDVAEILAAIDRSARFVILSHPGQPVGTAMDAGDLRRIVAQSADVGALCLLDEAYYPFHPVTMIELVREFSNVVIARSFSKYPGCAGLRLGFAVANPSLIRGLMSVRGGNEVAGVSLALGCYLLDHPSIAEDFRTAVEKGRVILNAGALRAGLEPLDCVTNFQLLRCPPTLPALVLAGLLKKRRYLVKADFSHPAMAGCLRVTINGPDIMVPFTEALKDAVAEAMPASKPVRIV